MIEGILCVDKPAELTSHDVVARVRRLANTRRVGHGGTLDPLATGLLVLAIGRATRLLEYVLGQPKEYQALVRLGQTSNTYDGEGKLVQSGEASVTEVEIAAMLNRFRGEIWQRPPMFSAIKREGKPLYELARKGVEVEREPRQVTIYDLEMVRYEAPDVSLRVVCSSGTYIRSLAHDLGQALGSGAYLAALRRTAVGGFNLAQAAPMRALTAEALPQHVQPMDSAVAHLPELTVSAEDALRLSQGKWVSAEERDAVAQSPMRVYDEQGTFVGIAVREGERWRPQKIFYEALGGGEPALGS